MLSYHDKIFFVVVQSYKNYQLISVIYEPHNYTYINQNLALQAIN